MRFTRSRPSRGPLRRSTANGSATGAAVRPRYYRHQMSKSVKPRKSKLERAKDLPWLGLLQIGIAFGERWSKLSEKERARLTGLLRDSKGHLGSLTEKERGELRKLAGKLDVRGLGGDLVKQVRRAGLLGGRRRR